jgi:hypothetical protein
MKWKEDTTQLIGLTVGVRVVMLSEMGQHLTVSKTGNIDVT